MFNLLEFSSKHNPKRVGLLSKKVSDSLISNSALGVAQDSCPQKHNAYKTYVHCNIIKYMSEEIKVLSNSWIS